MICDGIFSVSCVPIVLGSDSSGQFGGSVCSISLQPLGCQRSGVYYESLLLRAGGELGGGVPRAAVVSASVNSPCLLGRPSLKDRGCLAHLLGSPSAPGGKGSGQGSRCLHPRCSPVTGEVSNRVSRVPASVSGPLSCASQVLSTHLHQLPLGLGSRG